MNETPYMVFLKHILCAESFAMHRQRIIGWHVRLLSLLREHFPECGDYIGKVEKCGRCYSGNAKACISILEALKASINNGLIEVSTEKKKKENELLPLVFKKFNKVSRQLRYRHENRSTLDIEDEYDVQDLLHALLLLFFDDVRTEEWAPSFAGMPARMDFLIKQENIVIEVKKTRKGLADKEIGNQLIEDIERYKQHPDCKQLICFVYDPDGQIRNPDGLINDLNTKHNGFVQVFIEPR